jgi:hypothetical protein
MVLEAYTRYGSGFDQPAATEASKKIMGRDLDPGWVGEMILKTDPSDTLSRFQVQAGMTVLVKGFVGTGDTGTPFHIAEATISPEEGTVTCKIDTKYRDLLTLEEIVQRTRDPLTPTKMLQVNRRTVLIEDVIAPWDYTAGSGYMPRKAVTLLSNSARSMGFPWCKTTNLGVSYTGTTIDLPPRFHPEYYIKVKGKDANKNNRWAFFPILTSQRGSIRRIEMQAFDLDGKPIPVPFHLSIYHFKKDVQSMPMKNGIHSPFFDGSFETTAPDGAPWPAGSYFAPDPSIVIGWGNLAQPAGYSPGSLQAGNPATGALVDEATWTFDNMDNQFFKSANRPGQTAPVSDITLYGALYTDYPANVYFLGRMYRQEPGT